MTIPDKGAFKRLSSAGLLGNTFRQWDTLQGVRDAGYNGWLTVRARRASDSKLFIPVIHTMDVAHRQMGVGDWHLYTRRPRTPVLPFRPHCALADVYLQECPAPDTQRIVNLEAAISPVPGNGGLYVRYAPNDPTNLRHSLERNGQDAEGLTAWHVLQHYLQEDAEVLYDIWDLYPDAVIEASRFSRAVGTLNSKLIIWEVRNF